MCDLRAPLPPAPGSPPCAALSPAPGLPLCAALSLTLGSPLCGGAPAHARFAASAALSRRSVRRFVAALSLAPGSPPGSPLRCAALAHARFAALCFRRRQRLFVRPSGAAPARARLAALWRRSRSRPARRFVAALSLRSARRFVAALSLTPGLPLRCGALAPLGLPLCGGGFRRLQRLFVRPSGRAPARARLAASVRRSRSRSARRPFCPCSKPCSKNARALFLSTGSRLKYP